MKKVYLYVLDTLADWEIGHVTSEIKSRRFFKKDAEDVEIITASYDKKEKVTMGGLKVIPEALVSDIKEDKDTILILPGADTWQDARNYEVIQKAKKVLECGGTICAICGATVALANAQMLDNVNHTSNGRGFLEMFAPGYTGGCLYKDDLAIKDGNIITAGCIGGLEFSKLILDTLNVFKKETMDAWYKYFSTKDNNYFFEIMNSLDK